MKWLYHQKYANQINLNHTTLENVALLNESLVLLSFSSKFVGSELFLVSNSPNMPALDDRLERPH